MRLAPLLAALPEEELERLAVEHVRTDETLPRVQLCNFLEGALRSYRFVNDFVTNRQPPTFAMLTLLFDATDCALPANGFRELVMQETQRIAHMIDRGELLTRDDGLRLYRRALFEARRNDLDINSSEASILAVLRRESGITQVEHFLIEHHQDLREFWEKEHSFLHEQTALRSAGLIFAHEAKIVIADEVAPAIRQTLGIDMPTDAARRLLGHLSSTEMAAALEEASSRTAGSKDARLDRILTERIQPHVVLRSVGLGTLREICRDAGAPIAGNKDDLVDRIIHHFAHGRDQAVDEPPSPPRKETRRLDEVRFSTLFGSLRHQELADILRRFDDLRQTGTKEVRIATLWETHLAEETLLSELMNRDLEDVLHRLGLRLGGSKTERIARIIDHFASTSSEPREPHLLEINDGNAKDESEMDRSSPPPMSSALAEAQEAFRQKSSNPQASLQPWLEQVLDAPGLIRCYATEDANPTKQLKNKLSQAVAARGGVLVLTLADEAAFQKTHEALVERWATNDEWPKSVACVALAYPFGSPAIRVIVEWTDSPWPVRIRERLFPEVRLFPAKGSEAVLAERKPQPSALGEYKTIPGA